MVSPKRQKTAPDQSSDSDTGQERQDIVSSRPADFASTASHAEGTTTIMQGAEELQGAAPKKRTSSGNTRALSIILVNEPHQGQTEAQRKAVRSHAMRDYHKRMKQSSQVSSPVLSLNTGTSSKRPRSSLHESSLSRLSLSSPGIDSRYSNVPNYDTMKMSFSSGDNVHPSGLPEFDRWQYNTSTPYALAMGSGAPTLYMQAKRWPFVRHACGATPGISLWMPEVSIPIPSAYANRPCLLKSAKTVSWISSSLEYLEFKGETVKWINSRLEDRTLGPSDSTIGIIMCLANWEIARGSSEEVEQHMDGLQRILQIRGGIDSLDTIQHFQTKIAVLDILVAALTNSKARFPIFFVPRPHLPPPLIQGLDTKPVPDCPLYGVERLDQMLADSPFGDRGIKTLQEMRDLTNRVLGRAGATSSVTQDSSMQNKGDVISNPIFSDTLPSASSSYAPISSDNYEEDPLLPHLIHAPIIHAASIYTNVLSPFLGLEIPPNYSQSNSSWRENQKSLDLLVQSLQFPTHDAVFAQYPGVLVWILLVAAVAAEGRPERGFLAMFLTKIGTGSEYGWWDEMREMVDTFRRVREVVG